MDFDYFIYWCKEKWNDLKCFWAWVVTVYSIYADKLNIFLAKNNIVKLFTVYDVIWIDTPVAIAATYDKLNKHYDDLIWQANQKLIDVEGLKGWELTFKSRKSFIRTIFKTTLL